MSAWKRASAAASSALRAGRGAPRGCAALRAVFFFLSIPGREITRRRAGCKEQLARDRVEQADHRLVGPVVRVAIDLLVAAGARGVVDALALAEPVPELFDFLGRHVVGAAVVRLGAHCGLTPRLECGQFTEVGNLKVTTHG